MRSCTRALTQVPTHAHAFATHQLTATQPSTDTATLAAAIVHPPCCHNCNVSHANVEKVLNPPHTPTVMKNHRGEVLPQTSAPATAHHANKAVASTFAANTPHGNPAVASGHHARMPSPRPNRITLPKPPPRNTATHVNQVTPSATTLQF